MKPFCKLADPVGYVACDWDFALDPAGRAYWIEFFPKHLDTILRAAVEAATARGQTESSASARAHACRCDLVNRFEQYAASPLAFGRVTILTFDAWRDEILRRHGFVDPFIDLKHRENERVLPLLPRVCQELDSLEAAPRLLAVIEGVFAGNIFDMGASATASTFARGGPNFFHVRDTLAPRPWLLDDFEQLQRRFLTGPAHRRAVFFIDNAGSDFVLGALPLVRWLALRGTHVVVAANERPSLNDMTIHDVRALWPRVLQIAPDFAPLPIEMVSTGTGEPLIDLSAVSHELNSASRDADLVILEGMGRAVESNLDARFTCEALNLAMIKDEVIARRAGGKLFDVVCRFR